MRNILFEGYEGPRLPREVQLRRLRRVIEKELTEIMNEGKNFPVECQFCDTVYEFTPEDILELIKNA